MPPHGCWEIAALTPGQEGAYQELVSRAPFSPLTHTLPWREALVGLGLGEPVYWLAFKDGRLRGALPAFVRRTDAGAVLNSLPFVQSTGGVVCAADAGPAERSELTRVLGEALLAWCGREGVGVACVIGPAFTPDPEDAWPRPPDFALRRTVRALDLAEPLAYCPSVQGSIKKAARFNPVLREAQSAAEAQLVHGLYADHMRGLGVEALPWPFFAGLRAEGGSWVGARFVWAEVGGEPAAGMILMGHGRVVDYYSVGTTPRGRSAQAGSWLCDRMIRAARAAGVRWWNWMASPSPAVYDFKKRWGGADRAYTIRGWVRGDPAAWRARSPAELRALFPGYFVLPYETLTAAA
jgi:hypothetical protein